MRNILVACIAIGLVILLFGCFTFDYMNEQTTTCTVEDKWVKRPSSGSNELYLVSCGDTVYKVDDLLFKGKFNSADIYASLKVGKTYEITTTGFRLGFFSEYQNINSYKEVEVSE